MIDHRLAKLIALCTLPLFFLPKVNVVDSLATNAGVRIDDFVLLFVGLILFSSRLLYPKRPSRLEWIALAIFATSVASTLLSRFFLYMEWIRLESNPLFVIRFVEYFTFFYIGWGAGRSLAIDKLLIALLVTNGAIMLLQWKGAVGAFGVYGYDSDPLRRPSGLFGNAAECALFINMCAAYLLFGFPEKWIELRGRISSVRISFDFFVVPLVLGLLLLTEARIPQAAFALLLLALFWKRGRLQKPLAWPFIACGVVLLIAAVITSQRSSQLLSSSNFELAANLYNEIDVEGQDYLSASKVNLFQQQCDLSWFMRLHKWLYTLKYWIHHPFCWLLGLGPGVCFNALDGAYLRILCENGVVGLLLYLSLFVSIARMSSGLKWAVVLFLLNMLFIDSYLSYKPMALLFFLVGSYESSRAKDSDVGNRARWRGSRCADQLGRQAGPG